MNKLNSSICLCAVATLFGCASTNSDSVSSKELVPLENHVEFMQACDNETMEGKGPISQTLYVVGSFSDSDWTHIDNRKYQYKGHNIYQVVSNEKAGTYKMQYASYTWSPQFTAKGLNLPVGQLGTLSFGGYGSDTEVVIPEDGSYVWSLQFNADGSPNSLFVAQCN